MARDLGFDVVAMIMAGPRTPPPPPPPALLSADFDCVSCGACCVEAGEVPVRPDDPTPRALTASIEGVTAFAGEDPSSGLRRMARSPGRRCGALEGRVGTACSCGTYEARPAACRDFAPRSDGCLAAREAAERKLRDPASRWWGYGDDAEVARQRAEWGA